MDEITVTIRAHENKLKVIWAKGVGNIEFPPYYINRPFLENCRDQVRAALGALVTQALSANGAARLLGPQLRTLAAAGNMLYKQLFTDAGGSETDPQEIREWLAAEPGPIRLTIKIAEYIHIPWGLAFDAEPNELPPGPDTPDPADLGEYRNFWAFKYQTCSLYWRIPPRNLDVKRDADSLKVLSAISSECISAIEADMSAEEKAFLPQLAVDPVHTKAAFWNAWKNQQSNLDLLYFYCHANGSSLLMQSIPEDQITVMELHQDLNRPAKPSPVPCLVILNGCHTAAGDQSGTFLEATGRPGFCGFIGTETRVPNLFAKRFMLALHDRLKYEGEPLQDVFHSLRVAHWPLSLIYSLCAYGGFRVNPGAGSRLYHLGTNPGNFSFQKLGSGLL